MAIVICPECGKGISDKAVACIHCGCPMNYILQNQKKQELTPETVKESAVHDIPEQENDYKVIVIDYGAKKIPVITAMKKYLHMSDETGLKLLKELPCTIEFKKNFDSIIFIERLDSLPIEYELYEAGDLKKHKYKDDITVFERSAVTSPENGDKLSMTKQFMCPKCSAMINETARKCPNCGFDEISSYLLQIERDKQSRTIDYTHAYEPITIMEDNIPKCPTCRSTRVKRISGTKRWITTGLFGIGSTDMGKTMQCENCGYKW